MKQHVEIILYYIVKSFGASIRKLPVNSALWIGRRIGSFGYYFDKRHKAVAYANLKIAFARTKKPSEIKRIVKKLFQNYGQNIIELFRLPLITPETFENYVRVEGREHVENSLKKGKGLILSPMHFGSWELASFSFAMLGHPYKVIVNPQKRFSKLDELLNSYRQGGGFVVVSRGMGTRECIKSLQNNEIIGMVIDQGGRDGALVNFFGRSAAMSVGAIRLGLKFGVPICFSVIIRQENARHRLIIHPPLELINTGDTERDVVENLRKVVGLMEQYIHQYPSEYMWFYKIWKYSKESETVILNDGKTGHLRQSENVAQKIAEALAERDIKNEIKVVDVKFKSPMSSRLNTLLSFISHKNFCQGRIRFLKWFLTKESFLKLASVKADFVISCGSSIAGVNFFLSRDFEAKSIAILKPSILSFDRFTAVILPEHDRANYRVKTARLIYTNGAPNLVTEAYLQQQLALLLQRYTHLRYGKTCKIGILLGGDAKKDMISETGMRLIIRQIKEAAQKIDAEILLTTSRRTPPELELVLKGELKKFPLCRLLIIANEKNVPEAVGGILGLSEIVIVSGDSISMISEAASSGKNTIVFPVGKKAKTFFGKDRHDRFIGNLSHQGYVLFSDEKHISQTICEMAKNKIKTKKLDDNQVLLEAARNII